MFASPISAAQLFNTHLSHKHVGGWRVGCRDMCLYEPVNAPPDVAQGNVPLAIHHVCLLELKCTQGQVGDSPAHRVRRLDLVCAGATQVPATATVSAYRC